MTDWKEAIEYWRALTPEQQRQIRRQRLPRKVARSMAFAGEPVDQKMLEEELHRLTQRSPPRYRNCRAARETTLGSSFKY